MTKLNSQTKLTINQPKNDYFKFRVGIKPHYGIDYQYGKRSFFAMADRHTPRLPRDSSGRLCALLKVRHLIWRMRPPPPFPPPTPLVRRPHFGDFLGGGGIQSRRAHHFCAASSAHEGGSPPSRPRLTSILLGDLCLGYVGASLLGSTPNICLNYVSFLVLFFRWQFY